MKPQIGLLALVTFAATVSTSFFLSFPTSFAMPQVLAQTLTDRRAEADRLVQLKQEGTTEEGIAYAKADYFASRQLWGDVLREVYAVNNPSEGLTRFIYDIQRQYAKALDSYQQALAIYRQIGDHRG